MSYCYIVTERHASSTSSPTTSNSTIAARSPRGSVSHNFAQLRSCTARGVVSNDDGAHSPSTSSFAAATSSRALLEQGRRRGRAPRVARYAASSSPRASLYRERRARVMGDASAADGAGPRRAAIARQGEQGLQLTRNCAASTGAVSLLSERSAYNHECGPRTAACACRLQQ